MSSSLHTLALAAALMAGACTTQLSGTDDDVPGVDAGVERADDFGDQADAAPEADAAPVFEGCEDGDSSFEANDGTCYMYFFQAADWDTARTRCQLIGGDLARVDDAVRNGVLASFVPSAFPEAWLRGTDAQSEGLWTWGGTEPLTFANWRAGEPNNGGGNGAENCMIIQSNQGGVWDDRACSEQHSYLCER